MFFGGVATATFNPEMQDLVFTAKRETRVLFGLPKAWVPLVPAAVEDHRVEVSCPDPKDAAFVVTGGQSNAANSNSSSYVTRSSHQVVELYHGQCFVHADPVLGATGTRGSLWVEFGDRLAEEIDRDVVFVHTAIGGTQFSDWNDDRSTYFAAFRDRIIDADKAGFSAPIILWHQGETDAGLTSDFAQFKVDVETLLQRMLDLSPGASIYLFEASRCIGGARQNGVTAITDSLHEVADHMEDVTPGLNTDILDADYRSDGCHFNSLGRHFIAEAAAPEVAEMILTRTQVVASR